MGKTCDFVAVSPRSPANIERQVYIEVYLSHLHQLQPLRVRPRDVRGLRSVARNTTVNQSRQNHLFAVFAIAIFITPLAGTSSSSLRGDYALARPISGMRASSWARQSLARRSNIYRVLTMPAAPVFGVSTRSRMRFKWP